MTSSGGGVEATIRHPGFWSSHALLSNGVEGGFGKTSRPFGSRLEGAGFPLGLWVV